MVATFPPGVAIPSFIYDENTINQAIQVEEYMLDLEASQEEKEIMKECIQDLPGDLDEFSPRHYALLTMDTSDLDEFEEQCNRSEEYHSLLAKSPQGEGQYLYIMVGGCMVWGRGNGLPDWVVCRKENNLNYQPLLPRRKTSKDGIEELDQRDRIIVNAIVHKKGANYINAISKYGKVYCALKYSRFIPEEGSEMKCVVSLAESEKELPLKCMCVIPR